jgi:hypothetical protein
MKHFLIPLLLSSACLWAGDLQPIHKLGNAELSARIAEDATNVLRCRDGMQSVLEYTRTHPEIFNASTDRDSVLLSREKKEDAWQTWQRLLDYTLASDSTEHYHANWWRLKGEAREDSFLINYAAMLAKHRAGLEFIRAVEKNPELDKVLNDAVPELGLPAGTYAKLKYKNLNVRIASEFVASDVVLKTFTGGRHPELRAAIKNDASYLWKGAGRTELLTAKNALKVLQRGANTAWFPVQAGVSEWMGDTKVYRVGKSLISDEQIEALRTNLQPGDVLLERREWYLSNVGLPGFWPHAALYIGTPEERTAFFADPEVKSWVKEQGEPSGDFNALLRRRSAAAFTNSIAPQEHEHVVRVLEAMSEGVSFTTIEHSASCDSLAVLRPRRSKVEKAKALLRAFHYAGRPYDFNFDFSTDATLVCTELVYKSYEPAVGMTGLIFPMVEMLGRQVTPANELVKQFDAQFGTPRQQYELVTFIDGFERKKKAAESTLESFRASWKRPKWHVLTAK